MAQKFWMKMIRYRFDSVRLLQLWKFVCPFFIHQKKLNWRIINKKFLPNYTFAISSHRKIWTSLIPAWMIVYAAFWENKKNTTESKTNTEDIIEKADDLFEDMQYDNLYELLYPERLSDNDEILWRLARVICQKALMTGTSEQEKSALLEEGLIYIKRALEINDNNYHSHMWYALLVGFVAKDKSLLSHLTISTESFQHMEKAIQLCPIDAIAHYVLGFWTYSFAVLPWYQRKIASLFFGTPPTSTFEEALQYFKKAERLHNNFLCLNLLMMAKTYLKLNQKEKAIELLKKVKNYPLHCLGSNEDAYNEAVELLKTLTES